MSAQMIPMIGRKIRTIRLEKKMSIQEVADSAEISKGMLSKIENGRSIPSLQVLLNVIKGLNIDIPQFFTGIFLESDKRYLHVKANELTKIEKEQETVGYEYKLAFGSHVSAETMEVVLLTIQPNTTREKVVTDAYELKVMLTGEVDYYLDDEVVHLDAGDFFFYNGRIPHVPINTGTVTAQMLVVYFFGSAKD